MTATNQAHSQGSQGSRRAIFLAAALLLGLLAPLARGADFAFSGPSALVHNTDGQVTVTVERNFTGAATVAYQTFDDTAVSGTDYVATTGTLSFSGNQSAQTITVPILLDAGAPGSTTFSIQLSNPGGGATIGAPGSVNVSILNAEEPDSDLSDTGFTLPRAPKPANGTITVNLSPAAADGQWRLFGELSWRNSGATATGLIDANYEILFKPALGYQQPDSIVVPLLTGSHAILSGTYAVNGSPGAGSLQVNLAPQGTGGWRFQGETAWRPGGQTVANLNTGDYILEFEPVTGLATPPNCQAVVYANDLATVNITYFVADSTTGKTPILVSDTVAQTRAPFVYTGQIQTDEGLGSGFAPLDRVVVTAAHVLFDDSTLSFVSGVRWFFQYETGIYEGPPHVPAGFFVLSGYAGQRDSDIASGVNPGVATVASRELDAAAIYFFEDVARGGYSGYLGSDSPDNPWLTGSLDKIILGYPATGVADPGRLYGTPIVTKAYQYVTGSLFSTTAVTSFSGNSGGPVFVRDSNGHYYPAAIYLGGSDETIVHAIDSNVIALMKRAETTGNGGANNSGGGITQVSEGISGLSSYALGEITVTLAPDDAVSDGAYWEDGDGVQRFSGQTVSGLAPGSYTLQFFPGGPGYSPPANANVTVTAGNNSLVTATYTPGAPTITSATEATVVQGQSFSYQAAVTPGATTTYAITSGTLPAGLTLDGTSGLISGVVSIGAATGVSPVVLQATNGQGGGPLFPLSLDVSLPGQLTVSVSGKGVVPEAFAKPTIQPVGSPVSIKATPAPGYLFADWTDADTGAVLSIDETYAFTMPALLDLEANFVANPFLTGAGTYFALLQGGTYSESGMAQLTVAANGSFTATFTLGGNATKVTNKFDNTGQYQGEFEIAGSGLFDATLSLAAGGLLSGTLVNQGDGSQIQLNAGRIAARADQSLAGAYTVVLPAASGAGLPGGNGYGGMTVYPGGAVRFAGKLGDGLPVTFAGSLDANGILPFLFAKPAGATSGAEWLLGSVAFPPAVGGTAGTLNWYRAPNPDDPVYPDGFSTMIPFVAGRYTPPPVKYPAAVVTFSGADLAAPLIEPITISPAHRVTPAGPTPFTLLFTPATGLFTGSFPDNGAARVFSGAVLQTGSTGLGLFQEPSGDTGSVLLQGSQ